MKSLMALVSGLMMYSSVAQAIPGITELRTINCPIDATLLYETKGSKVMLIYKGEAFPMERAGASYLLSSSRDRIPSFETTLDRAEFMTIKYYFSGIMGECGVEFVRAEMDDIEFPG